MPDYLGREGEFGGGGRGSVVRHGGETPAPAVVAAKPPPLHEQCRMDVYVCQ